MLILLRRILFVIFVIGITSDFLGPAEFQIKRLEQCGEDLLGVEFTFLRHRINRTTQGTNMNFSSPFPIDDTIALNLSASIWGDGGWKPNAFEVYNENLCNFMMTAMPNLTSYMLNLLKQPLSCPLAAGTYILENFEYSGELTFPFLYGDFMFDFSLTKNGVIFLCTRVFIISKPKMK
ncbi:uncharacterized protein LOC143919222 [Arctopsyche grandis]|uniref:uncharacterized protein LOC143919222 n=1 Tax=Arctopsyche grandis TaxID=121162 RepID=UPI00406D8D84